MNKRSAVFFLGFFVFLECSFVCQDVFAGAAVARTKSKGNRQKAAAPQGPAPMSAAQAPSGPTRLTTSEYNFLLNLGRSISQTSPAVRNQIYGIIEALKKSPRLEPANYDFLVKLSQGINNKQISDALRSIAENHRP